MPAASADPVEFTDLFDIDEIQSIQDAFADATGVASVITYPDGTPITTPSNFCRLCSEVIRGTTLGLANCKRSDAAIGNSDPAGAIVHRCLSGGLWDAGASITVGGHHVANWLIGQVRNELQNDQELLKYADVIGADPEEFRSALEEVPTMSLDRFEMIARALFFIANQLSVVAYQNVQQARLIAEREQANAALRDSERWLNESQRVAGLGHYVYDIANDHWDGSAPLYELFGIDEEYQRDLRGFLGIVHPDDREMVSRYFSERVLTGLEAFDLEYRIVRPSDGVGRHVHGLGKVEFEEGGSPLTMFGVIQDITDRVSVQHALRDSIDTFRFVFEFSVVAQSITLPTGEIQGNEAFYQMLGYKQEELVASTTIPEFTHPDDVEMSRRYSEQLLAGETDSVRFEKRYLHRNGSVVWADVSMSLRRDSANEPLYFMTTMLDITERKKAETALQETTEQLEQLLAERERNMKELATSFSSIVAVVGHVVETRDPYTAGHERRVSELAVSIARELDMSAEQVEEIRLASLIHDVGKMSVPAEILSKPGKLSPIEFELIKGHSESGFRILSAANMSGSITEMVYQHHERCDGSGYPRGLQAQELLPGAKVIQVADVVEAMVSHRPYRAGLGRTAALAEIERGAGVQYDAGIVEACLRLFRENRFEFSPHMTM